MSEREFEYPKTHPWLDFAFDYRRLSPAAMFAIGAASSKCRHVGRTLLPPDVHQEFLKIYLAKGALATTAIEGVTLSEEVAQQIVRGVDKVPPSRAYQKRAIENIVEASNGIVETSVGGKTAPILAGTLKDFNRRVLQELPLEEDVVPGEFAPHQVVVGRYRGAPRRECEHLIDRLCEWIREDAWAPLSSDRAAVAILRAVLAHLYFVWIHPFGDGNGRTARLLELRILFDAVIPMPCAHLLSNHYNLTRDEYYRRLDRASKARDPYQFVEYAVQGFVDGLEEQIGRINTWQWRATWNEHVYDVFSGQSTITAHRQRQVALLLYEAGPEGVEISKLPSLSPDVARSYGQKTSQTLKRDVRVLQDRGLVEAIGKRVRASFPSLVDSRLPVVRIPKNELP